MARRLLNHKEVRVIPLSCFFLGNRNEDLCLNRYQISRNKAMALAGSLGRGNIQNFGGGGVLNSNLATFDV